MTDNYHHGNLRQALIDAGIRIINESGEEALSLRKVAAACGVSHAAPYAHFVDKDALLEAIKECVTKRFTDELEDAVASAHGLRADDAIDAMGHKYIMFFRENPDYFNFLFHKQKIEVHLSMDQEYENDYYPFLILRRYFMKYLEENRIDLSKEEQEIQLIKTWALVQGISSIVCMENVSCSKPWDELLDRLLKP